jgi:single-strand DNA-binding protein
MLSLNKVLLIGNLTRDPEMRYIPSGTAVAEFGLAIDREWKDKSGEKKDDTCFVDITVWGRTAEICNQYLKKGRQVYIEGRLDYSAWETKEGDKRSKLRVVADRVQFLSSGQGRDGAPGANAGPSGASDGVDEGPPSSGMRSGGSRGAPARQGGARSPAPSAGGAQGGVREGGDDLNLDDIPF